jgi:hypothetical protein
VAQRPEHVAVVGERDRAHALSLHAPGERAKLHRTREERVLRVQM